METEISCFFRKNWANTFVKIAFIFSFVLLTRITHAQNQIATLSHDGEISTFYGANALSSAHKAAQDGDVITLSAGSFNAIDITKRISIRGAGMGVKLSESDSYVDPTIILGNFDVTADGNSDYHLSIEGIRHDETINFRGVHLVQLIKCQLGEVKFTANYGSLEDLTFVHCYVSKKFQSLYNTVFVGINSYFKDAFFGKTSNTFSLTNCIIETNNPDSGLAGTNLKNCIVIYTGTASNPYSYNPSIYNTLWFGPGENPFINASVEHGNYWDTSIESLFFDETFFQLTESAKQYLGTDGTELGIYGGNLPFSPTPSNPQITKFKVAQKTTADGKLSVDIEVK